MSRKTWYVSDSLFAHKHLDTQLFSKYIHKHYGRLNISCAQFNTPKKFEVPESGMNTRSRSERYLPLPWTWILLSLLNSSLQKSTVFLTISLQLL